MIQTGQAIALGQRVSQFSFFTIEVTYSPPPPPPISSLFFHVLPIRPQLILDYRSIRLFYFFEYFVFLKPDASQTQHTSSKPNKKYGALDEWQ